MLDCSISSSHNIPYTGKTLALWAYTPPFKNLLMKCRGISFMLPCTFVAKNS